MAIFNYPASLHFSRFTPVRLSSGNPAPILRATLEYFDEFDAEEYFLEQQQLHWKCEVLHYNDEYVNPTSDSDDCESSPLELDDNEIMY